MRWFTLLKEPLILAVLIAVGSLVLMTVEYCRGKHLMETDKENDRIEKAIMRAYNVKRPQRPLK